MNRSEPKESTGTRRYVPEMDLYVDEAVLERWKAEQVVEHHVSMAVFAHVTLKKIPVQVRYTLTALATLWAIVLVSLLLSAGVAGLFALTGLFSFHDVMATFLDLWVCMSIVSVVCAFVVAAVTTK